MREAGHVSVSRQRNGRHSVTDRELHWYISRLVTITLTDEHLHQSFWKVCRKSSIATKMGIRQWQTDSPFCQSPLVLCVRYILSLFPANMGGVLHHPGSLWVSEHKLWPTAAPRWVWLLCLCFTVLLPFNKCLKSTLRLWLSFPTWEHCNK